MSPPSSLPPSQTLRPSRDMYRSLKLRIYTYPYFYFYLSLYYYSYSASRVTPASMLRYVFSGFALPSLCFSSLVKKCFNLEEASIFCLSISTAHCVGIVLFFSFFFFLNYFFFFLGFNFLCYPVAPYFRQTFQPSPIRVLKPSFSLAKENSIHI